MPLASRLPASRAVGAPSEERVEVVPGGTSRTSRDEGFAAFMAKHQGDLLRTAWLLCGDANRAEELTQLALVRTYAAWPRASSGDPLAYARRVLVNLRVDTWRRRRREVLTSPERMPELGVPADRRADDRDQLVRALATLTTRQRRVIVLRHLLDLSESDVAAELGITVGTVKSTASRALAALRASMADDDRPLTSSPRRSS